MIRPRPARWFEALVARDDCALLLEALGAAGCVELEARPGAGLPTAWRDLEPGIQRFAGLRARYGRWWPREGLRAARMPEPPLATLARGNAALEAWAAEAEPLVRELEALAQERAERERWLALLALLAQAGHDAGALARAGPLAAAVVLEAAEGQTHPAEAAQLLLRPLPGEPRYAIAVGSGEALARASRETAARHGRVHPLPAWISGDRARDEAAIGERIAVIDGRRGELEAELRRANDRHGLHRVLADLLRVQWVHDNVRALESGERLAWITGWSSDARGELLDRAVQGSGARALLHFATPPDGLQAPLLLANPRWARPFELFPRALGVPGRDEADPTLLLALVVPLLFGYMFADVGQGLLIAALAWHLRARLPVARLLFAGGLAACAFGFVFGSVFSVHGLMRPLWIDPLDAPVTVLAVPLAGGALLLGCGLLLHALGSLWRGEHARLLGEDLGLVAIYAGLLAGLRWPQALWAVAAGVAASLAGSALHARRASALLSGLGELVERLLQLLINTLSFARVGAFALAHSGLSAALAALAAQLESVAAQVLVFVAGNLLIVALETLVVSIQTTRLVLFEFFARFLTGLGRPFRPLPLPPTLVQE